MTCMGASGIRSDSYFALKREIGREMTSWVAGYGTWDIEHGLLMRATEQNQCALLDLQKV